MDEPPAGRQRDKEPFQVVMAHELGIKPWRRFIFQYSAFELSCALKSYFPDHLLRTTSLQKLLFIDGDIVLCSSLTSILATLDQANIVLTPQLTEPRSVEALDRWEADILDTGAYNAGFWAIRKSMPAFKMLQWWQTRVERLSKFEINHYEQGWLDPALFDGVHIERGCQYNLLAVHPGGIKAAQVIRFLNALRRHRRKRVILFWDRLPAHRSARVQQALGQQLAWLSVEWQPAYAPELNPLEPLWDHLDDTALANTPIQDLGQLRDDPSDASLREIQVVIPREELRGFNQRLAGHALSSLSVFSGCGNN